MIMWEALLGLVLVGGALMAACWAFWRAGYSAGYEAHGTDMAERRAQRRAEMRARAAAAGHQLAPFPDAEWTEKLASTGELRAAAESGDLDTLHRETAAFFRILSLRDWTRKRAAA